MEYIHALGLLIYIAGVLVVCIVESLAGWTCVNSLC